MEILEVIKKKKKYKKLKKQEVIKSSNELKHKADVKIQINSLIQNVNRIFENKDVHQIDIEVDNDYVADFSRAMFSKELYEFNIEGKQDNKFIISKKVIDF